MLRRFIKQYIPAIIISLAVYTPAQAVAAPHFASIASSKPNLSLVASSCGTAKNCACQGLQQLGGSNCSSGSNSTVSNLISTGVNILSMVVGALAVVMVIVAGFKYVTSGGDSNRVSSAKNTLMYAIIGLAIAALAKLIVVYVLNTSNAVGLITIWGLKP